MSKAMWEKAQEQLRNELDREPSGEEINERSADLLAKEIDKQYDNR